MCRADEVEVEGEGEDDVRVASSTRPARSAQNSGVVSELLLPVTTFRRVFDTMPVQEVLTLGELVAALRRFELRADVLARTQREIARARRATTRVKAGLHTGGGFEVRLKKAADDARKVRQSPDAAVEATGERLEDEARKKAKNDLRVWSPTLYAPGAEKRGGEHVTHLSCIVLDYDDGTSIDEASACWSQYFHMVHSTWSHTEARPRFRLVLPLAHLVPASAWARVWSWAAALASTRGGHAVDGALKNPSSHYALPAVPNLNWPRIAFCQPGAILSPLAEGLIDEVPAIELAPQGPTDGQPSVMRGLDPTRHFIDHVAEGTVYVVDDPWDDELEAERAALRVEAPAPVVPVIADPEPVIAAPAPTPASAEDRIAALEARVRMLESREDPRALVEALERLARLHEDGAIDEAELAEGKRRLLGRAPG